MLQVILDTRKMSDETRNYLENLIDLKDAMDEAEQALEDYLQETFGSLGLVCWTPSPPPSKGAVRLETLRIRQYPCLRISVSRSHTLFFADKFDDLQKQLKEVYGSGKSEEQIANDAMRLVDDFLQ